LIARLKPKCSQSQSVGTEHMDKLGSPAKFFRFLMKKHER